LPKSHSIIRFENSYWYIKLSTPGKSRLLTIINVKNAVNTCVNSEITLQVRDTLLIEGCTLLEDEDEIKIFYYKITTRILVVAKLPKCQCAA